MFHSAFAISSLLVAVSLFMVSPAGAQTLDE
jgi:hypothetical protein